MSRHRLLDELGRGGMGIVYRAEDTLLGREVALKFLPDHLANDPVALARFNREARAASALNHPNICTIYDVGEHEGRPYIAMEMLEGETLRERLERGRLTLSDALALGIEIAAAVEAAHARGVVHRDLKPANIFVTTLGHAKVMDFGLATAPGRGSREPVGVGATATFGEENLTSPGLAVGTVAYMSPEQARAEPLDARTDLFSLGAVLYEMASGTRAFPGDASAVIFDAILNREPPPLSRSGEPAPPELDRIVSKAITKNRDQRYQTAADLRADLTRLKQGLESGREHAAGPPSVTGRAGRGAHAGRRLLVAVGVLVVVGIAALVLVRGGGRWGTRSEPVMTRVPLPDRLQMSSIGLPVLSPDDRMMVYAQEGNLCLLFLATGDVRTLVSKDAGRLECIGAGWRSDGTHVVSLENGPGSRMQLAFVDILTGNHRVVESFEPDVMVGWPVLSPDARHVATLRGPRSMPPSSELWVSDLGTGRSRQILRVENREWIYPPVWSPDGRSLAYVRRGVDLVRCVLETCTLDGKRTELLPDSASQLRPSGAIYPTLAWLPDWRLVYHWRYETVSQWGSAELRWLKVNRRTGRADGGPHQLYRLPGSALVVPSASSDGRKLAFIARRQTKRLKLLTLDGDTKGSTVPAVPVDWETGSPVWSHDGNRLFFAVSRSGSDYDIYGRDLRSGKSEAVLATKASELPMCLTPDGQDLLCRQGARVLSVPVAGGPAHIVADSLRGGVLCAVGPGTRCLAVRLEGGDLVIRNFEVSRGVGEVLMRRKVDWKWLFADLSPDGERIALGSGERGEVEILSVSTWSVLGRVRVPPPGAIQSVRWSRDGKRIYMSGLAGNAPFWLRRGSLEASAEVLWTSGTAWPAEPAPSPDERNLAFTMTEFDSDMWHLDGI